MTKDTSMRLHRIYNIVLAVSVVIAGICFMAGCLYIYYGIGEYSREIVADVFRYIAIPVFICIGLILAGFIYELISPLKKKKEKPEKNYGHIRSNLSAKKNFSECDKALLSKIEKERKSRTVISVLRAVLICASFGVFLFYALNPAHYSGTEITDSVIAAMMWLAPCLAVSGAVAIFAAYFNEKSIKREIELLKKLPDAKASERPATVDLEDRFVVSVIRCVFIVSAAVALIIAGIYMGGYGDVLTKAVNICTECIGLG